MPPLIRHRCFEIVAPREWESFMRKLLISQRFVPGMSTLMQNLSTTKQEHGLRRAAAEHQRTSGYIEMSLTTRHLRAASKALRTYKLFLLWDT